MQLVPIQAVPNQQVHVLLNDQECTIKIYQRLFGLFDDLQIGTTAIVTGVIAQNFNRIVRSAYLGFDGDLIFADSQGEDDPDYTGLANRFELLYLSPDDLISLGLTA